MSREIPSADRNIYGVQYLRALAAIFVVYFHTHVYTESFAWSLPRAFGASGVDLFFVISGFIMMTITARSNVSPAQFLLRRFLRIVPLYWVVTLIIVVAGLVYPPSMLKNAVSFEHVGLSMLFIPHRNPVDFSNAPFFKLGWTLNYEVYFYLVFATLLLFLRTPRGRLMAMTLYAATVSILYIAIEPAGSIPQVYWNPIIIEFWMGTLVGYLFLKGDLSALPRGLALALVPICLAMMMAFVPDDSVRIQIHGVASAVLLMAVLSLEMRGSLPRRSLPNLLGDASYSIYLVHPLVESMARVVTKVAHLPVDNAALGAVLVVATTVVSVAGGVAAHLWIEKPLLAALRRLVERGRPAPMAVPVAAP
ncbi:acyltransferase family protein [Labrys wisconsinensis]|uniref:Peptidoglycan/LPS O-acetylase OafA/YrhL n=1 Tax=Labrys wisconsinensis TaxID=425677 RepID=A0ABU0JFI6_9HYPH|nr:acyltransferase [Labrys wisconsinensis]MDQ0473046.1 peptidoglycan/LPS O-acetylase OafA/YrhL [Labrys wisconsinensis]